MAREINWQRTEYESCIDLAAEDISEFVEAVLQTVDEDAARSSPAQWEIVCRYFAGCAFAALQQRNTLRGGGERIADYLKAHFPFEFDQYRDRLTDGFDEFMGWLSNPSQFSPMALRAALSAGK